MNKISIAVLFLAILFWPVRLILTNGFHNLIPFFCSLIIVLGSLFLIYRNSTGWYFPLILLPLVDIHFFPILIILCVYALFQKNKRNILYFAIPAILIFFLIGRNYVSHSIFILEYEAKQTILRNINLYPNPVYARFFQNKLNILVSKFENNFLSLIDPNNYFFGSHPHELTDNQNLIKIPFVALIFLLVGIFSTKPNTLISKIISLLSFLILTLALMDHFDKFDLVLWPFFAIFIYEGYKVTTKKSQALSFLLICALFAVTLIEYFTIPR